MANDSRKLPKIINDHLEQRELLNEHIRLCIDPIIAKGSIKELILGCSHFPIIEKEIGELYPELKLINPANKQVKILIEELKKRDLLREHNPQRNVDIFTTNGINEFKLTLNRLNIKDYRLKLVKLLEDD